MDIDKLEGIVIYILESLRDGDMHTGSNLYDALRQYTVDFPDIHLEYKYYKIDCKRSFQNALKEIKNDVENNSFSPIIQIECHGSKDGIELSSSEHTCWNEVFDNIRPINISSKNLLLLNLSMCHGDAVIRYINPIERAPFRAVIGPADIAYPESLQNKWSDFYRLCLQTLCEHNKQSICQIAQLCGLIYYNQEFIFDVHYDTPNLYPELFERWKHNNLTEMYKNEGPLMIDSESYERWLAKQFKQAFDTYKPFYCFHQN